MKKATKLLSTVMATVMLIMTLSVSIVSSAEVSGADIVNCAMQYIGKVPYVWGGTKIDGDNPGADCSGFICRLYEKFGINMWANRTALRNCGTNLGTDMSVAELGDIIWYEGHVAIYAGIQNGHHMVVHCTGGNIQNVAYSRDSHVNAEKKGIIRIPGVNGYAAPTQTSLAQFSLPTDSTYVSKQMISDTNAVVVNQVTKLSGVATTSSGIYLYDANQNLIKRHIENTTNVSNSLTLYHMWFDINNELGVTLTPGTTYYYKMFGIFNGTEVAGDMYSFTTTGPTPVTATPTPVPTTITLTPRNDTNSRGEVTVENGTVLYVDATQNSGGKISSCELAMYDSNNNALFTMTATEKHLANITDHSSVKFNWTLGDKAMPYFEDGELYYYYVTLTLENGESFRSDGYPCRAKIEDTTNKGNNVIKLIINYPRMFVNDKGQNIDDNGTAPVIKNDRTLLPVRAVIENMGGTVSWNGQSRTVILDMNNKKLFLQINNNMAWDDNGNTYTLDAAPSIINDRTMLPIRFVAEYFGGTVEWNAADRSVSIRY